MVLNSSSVILSAIAGLNLTTNTVTINSTVDTLAGSNDGVVTITNAGQLTIASGANITTDGAFTQNGAGPVSTAGNITTTNDAISFATAVTQAGAIVLNSGAGAGTITFSGTLNGTTAATETLSLTAGTGNVVFTGIVGGSTTLGAVSIVSATNVTASAAFSAASLVQTAGTSTTLAGNVTTTAIAGLNITATEIFLDGLDIATTNSGVVTLSGITDLTTAAVGINASGTITFDGALISSVGGAIALTLESAGNIDFDSTVGYSGGNELGAIIINTAVDVTAGSSIEAASLVQSAGTGTTTLTGAVALTAIAGLNITTDIVTISSTVNTLAGGNDGVVTITNAGLLTIASGANITTDGAFTQNGAGLVSTAGNITTTNDAISFATAVTLTGAVALDTGAVLGNITFSSTLDGAQTLSLTAGTGSIVFTGIVGATPLGAVTIVSAADVTVPLAFTATSLTQINGTGTTKLTGITTVASGLALNTSTIDIENNVITTGTLVNLDAVVLVNLDTGKSITTTAAADGAAISGAIDIDVSGIGTVTIVGSLDTSGADNADGNGSAGGAVTINTIDGTVGVANITTSGGQGSAANTGGLAGLITIADAASNAITLNGTAISAIGGVAAGAGTGGVGGAVTFSDIVTLAENIRIDTSGGTTTGGTAGDGGDILFSSTLTGTQTLDLDTLGATSGDITFVGTVGIVGSTPLAAVTIDAAKDVTASAAFSAASLVQSAGTGTTTLADDVTTTAVAGVNIAATNIVLDGLTITTTTGSGVVSFTGITDIATDTASIVAGGAITFTGVVTSTGDKNLTLSSTATVDFTDTVGFDTDNELGTITLTTATTATFAGTVEAGTITLIAASVLVDFQDAVTATGAVTAASGVVNLNMIGTGDSITTAFAPDNSGTLLLGKADGTGTQTYVGGIDTTGVGGVVTLKGTIATTNNNITATAITAGTALTLNAGTGTITTGGAITVTGGANAVTLTSDAIALGGTIITSGIVTVAPSTLGTSIGIGGGAGDLNLTDTEMGYLQSSTSNVVGAALGTGTVIVNTLTYAYPLTIRAGGTAGDITVAEPITVTDQNLTLTAGSGASGVFTTSASATIGAGSGDITITADRVTITDSAITSSGTITVSPSLATTTVGLAGGSGDFNLTDAEMALLQGTIGVVIGHATGTGAVAVGALAAYAYPLTIQAGGAATITVTGAFVTTDKALTFTAGGDAASGTFTITDGAGNSLDTGIGALTITADTIVLNEDATADTITSTGAIVLQPSQVGTTVGIAGGDGDFNLTVLELNSIADGADSITIGHASGTASVDVDAVTFTDDVEIRTSSGTITLNGDITNSGNDITLTGAVAIVNDGDITVTTGSGAGAILITGAVTAFDTNAGESLTFISGTGTTTVRGDFGTSGSKFNTVTIQEAAAAGAVAFNGDFYANTIVTYETATHALSFLAGGEGNVEVATATEFLNEGALILGDEALDTITFTLGVTFTGPSSVSIGGTLVTTNTDVSFGTTTLTKATTINAGTGDVTFTGVVSGGTNAITITANSIKGDGNEKIIAGLLTFATVDGVGDSAGLITQITSLTGTNSTDGAIWIRNNRTADVSAALIVTADDVTNSAGAVRIEQGNITFNNGVLASSDSTTGGNLILTGTVTASTTVKLHAMGDIRGATASESDVVGVGTCEILSYNGAVGEYDGQTGIAGYTPVEVNITGNLYVHSSQENEPVGVAIDGNVIDTEILSSYDNYVSTGLVLFNGRINGGERYMDFYRGRLAKWFKSSSPITALKSNDPTLFGADVVRSMLDESWFEATPELWTKDDDLIEAS